MTEKGIQALEKFKRKLQNAYYDRQDYPPFEIMGFNDRPKYIEYVNKILGECIESEK